MTREEAIKIIKSIKRFIYQPEWNAALNIAIEALQEPERKWIPVSERLPEEPNYYEVTVDFGSEQVIKTDFYSVRESRWGAYTNYVTAWRERLAEPYKAGSRMSCDRNKCYKQEYNGEGCDTCKETNIEDMIKALRCMGSVNLDSCYMNQHNRKHPDDRIYCKEGSCPHYQDAYGVCFGEDDTSWLALAADELERMANL